MQGILFSGAVTLKTSRIILKDKNVTSQTSIGLLFELSLQNIVFNNMKLITSSFLLALITFFANAQQTTTGTWWRAGLHRADGKNIVFNFEWTTEKGKPVWFIRNASERIKVTDIQVKADSLIIQMPLFESQFRIKKDANGLTGNWIKGGAVKTQIMPFTATTAVKFEGGCAN